MELCFNEHSKLRNQFFAPPSPLPDVDFTLHIPFFNITVIPNSRKYFNVINNIAVICQGHMQY